MAVNIDRFRPVEFSDHARDTMLDRGADEKEVLMAIRTGSFEPARKGRVMFRKNFEFHREWRGKRYAIKQVAPVVAQETDKLVVVTVYVYYF